jgi:hypothetical protein
VAIGISAGLLLSALNGEIGGAEMLAPRIWEGRSLGLILGLRMARLSDVAGRRADSAPHCKSKRCDDRRARHLITSHGHGRGIASFAIHPFICSARTPRASRYSPEGNFSDWAQTVELSRTSFWDE